MTKPVELEAILKEYTKEYNKNKVKAKPIK